MYGYTNIVYDLLIILLLIGGIFQFRNPRSATVDPFDLL